MVRLKTPVAVIVLNWNGLGLLKEFLPSVVKNTNPDLGSIIVADNASGDGSPEFLRREYPDLEVLSFDENYGYAEGYNKAIAAVESEYAVLLNSDVAVAPGWLEPLYAALEADKGLVAVQPKIRSYADKGRFEYAGACGGFMDYLGFPFCRGRILGYTEADEGQYECETEVFWCSGAALCIRRDAYMKAGGLDKAFFAHMEEIDLCWRIRNSGGRLKVIPSSVVYHLGGGSLPMHHPRKLFFNYRNNLLMLYKNLSPCERKKVMRIRRFVDFCSALVFLCSGQWANFKAVFAAYRSYREMRSAYTPFETAGGKDACIYRHSILFDYYMGRRRRFSDLKR